MVVGLVGVQGSSVLLYVYSLGSNNTIGHQLWFPNCVRLGGGNTWNVPNFKATGISKATEAFPAKLNVARNIARNIARNVARNLAHTILIHVSGSTELGILKLCNSH